MPDVLRDVAARVRNLERDQFGGAPARGGLPRMPRRDALPTASEQFEGAMLFVPGTTDGHVYICMLVSSAFAWVQLD